MQNISYGEFNKINSINFTSEYGKLKNIKLEGSTNQATRSGKNLFEINDISINNANSEIKIVDNRIIITALGTVGEQYAEKIVSGLESSKNYTFSFKAKKTVLGTDGLSIIDIIVYGSNDDSTYIFLKNLQNLSPVENKEYYFQETFTGYSSYRFSIYNNAYTPVTIGEQTEYYDIQLEEGSIATDYEQYGASPSPDYSSPIENVAGKNKLDYKTVSNTSNTVVSLIENGFNVKGNYAGKIVVNGLKQNTDYNLQYILQNITGNTHNVTIFANQETTTTIKTFSTLTGGKFNTGNYTEINIWFYANLGHQGEANFTNIQLEEGTVATPYVPYNSLEIKDIGENLFDKKTNTIFAWATAAEITEEGSVCSKNFIPTTKNKIYATNFAACVFYYDKKLNYLGNSTDLRTDSGNIYTTWTNPDNNSIAFMKVEYRKSFNNNLDMTTQEIMLTESGIVKPYKPYQEQKVDFPLSEGQKLMEGSYLADDGIHHKRNQIVLDGTENVRFYPNMTHTFRISIRPLSSSGICTHYKQIKSTLFDTETGMFLANSNSFIVSDPRFSTTEEFKAYLAQQYSAGTPVTFEYIMIESDLITPHEEIVPYTEAQQEAWNKIKNFPIFIGQNNLTSTALLSAIYIKKITTDTKVDYNLYNEDYIKIATKNNIHPKFKIQMLDEYENVIDEITGDISRDNSGSISNNYQQGVRRSVSLTFIDTEGKFLPDSNSNLIWANKKFKLFSGLLDTDTNEIFWFSEGIYYFSNVSSSRNGADKLTTVNGVDKFGKFGSELGYNQLESTYLIPAGTKIYDAIKGILNIDIGNGYPIDPIEPVLDPLYIDEVCPYDISKSPSSYLSEMLIELADIIGCDIYYDADGRLHVDSGTIDFSYSNKPSIWDFSDVLPEYMNPSITTNFAEFINTVKVVGNNTNDKTYEYTAVNNNPESPTRVDLIGTKSTYIESASVYNTDRAKDYAEYKLNMFSILQLAVTFSCTFLPHLDVNKVITITDSYYKYEKQRFVIQSITLPLSYDGVMSISACNVASLPYYEGGN